MTLTLDQIDANWLRRFRRNLLRWYGEHARDLPWRQTREAYRIWISEIMLQQTTVVAVVPYFLRFLERFPTVYELAEADESDVLRLWEGLGYYSRARNIHRTARKIVTEFDGEFPADVTALQTLPGIGRYTAGAIASFAFDLPAPIVEANTLRLYSRLLGYRGDPRSSSGQKLLWEFAARILPRKQPGEFNQAVMELGATVCTPSQPACPACPVKSCCFAFRAGLQDEIPLPPSRPEITAVTEAAAAIEHDGQFLLCRRGEGERWAGLWDFPRYPCRSNHTKLSNHQLRRIRADLQADLREHVGVGVAIEDMLTQLRHSVTRYRINLLCFAGRVVSEPAIHPPTVESAWVAPEQFEDFPLSVTGRKLAQLLIARADEQSADE